MSSSTQDQNRSRQSLPGERLGRWMVFGAWLLLMLLLTFFFSRWLDHQQNPNQHLKVESGIEGPVQVVLRRNRSGHYVAPGLINNQPVVFLLDTGATHVALSQTLAERVGLEKGPSAISMTANGPVRSWQAIIDRVRLGPITQFNVRASILPAMSSNEVLLGMSFLKHLELIQKDDQLIIKAPDGA